MLLSSNYYELISGVTLRPMTAYVVLPLVGGMYA
jgi:hypothetical protein